MTKELKSIPFFGAGLGYRREIHDGILAASSEVNFLEVITERYISAPKRSLDALAAMAEKFRVIPHGVSLSVGTAAPVSKTFLRAVKDVCTLVKAPYYSDHLAVTQSGGIDLGHLSPLVYNKKTLGSVIDNVNRVQDYLGLPFVIENITETHELPGSDMDSADFIARVSNATGCGILLDITNLYINSVNNKFDALQYAERLPLDRVIQVHLAGGYWYNGVLIDSHSEAVPENVWKLFKQLSPRMAVRAALVERDDNYPPFEELLAEVRLARACMMSAEKFPAVA